MSEDIRSRDLDWLSSRVESHFRDRKYQISRDVALWDGAPIVMLRARRADEDHLIEFRQKPDLPLFLQQFVDQAVARREPSMLSVAIAAPQEDDEEQVTISISSLQRLRALGVGLLQAGEAEVVAIERPVAFSARVTLPSELRNHASAIEAVAKFNRGDPLDGLRDVTTEVEHSVRQIAERAVSYKVVNCDEKDLAQMDLNGVIDLLGTEKYRSAAQVRVVETVLRNDLHSFRAGGRNIAHHAQRTRALKEKRDRQLSERMSTGLRLLADLHEVRVPKKRS